MQRLNKKALLNEGKLLYNGTFSRISKGHLEANNWVLNPRSQGLTNVLEIKMESPGPLALHKRSRQVFCRGFSKIIFLCDGAGSLREIFPLYFEGLLLQVLEGKQFAFLSPTSH